jgi:hypothetical protein
MEMRVRTVGRLSEGSLASGCTVVVSHTRDEYGCNEVELHCHGLDEDLGELLQ